MPKEKRLSFVRRLVAGTPLFAFFSIVVFPSSPSFAQQSQPPLQITSPADGTVVSPGQSVAIVVTPAPAVEFAEVLVAAEDPIGFSTVATAAPFQFSVTVPASTTVRQYHFTALGATSDGQIVESDAVTIDVERPDAPVKLTAQPPGIIFESQGEGIPLQIKGTFSDGTILDVTQSMNLSFSSLNASVATVDSTGTVTAMSPGNTSVVATYGQTGQGPQVTVAVMVPVPATTVSPPSLDFSKQPIGTASDPQRITLANTSNGPLRLLSISASGDFVRVSASRPKEEEIPIITVSGHSVPADNCSTAPIPVHDTCTVDVVFVPTADGVRNGQLTIYNSFAVIPTVVNLTGTGCRLFLPLHPRVR